MVKKKKSNLFTDLFIGIFGFVGAVMLIAGIAFSVDNTDFFRTAIPADATITDFKRTGSDDSPTTIVKYTVGDKVLFGELNYYSSTMKHGDTVSICYNPANPLDIRSESAGTVLVSIFSFLGITFIGIAVGCGVYSSRKKNRIRWLKRNGLCLQARITAVETNLNRTMGDTIHPLTVSCLYSAPDGRTYSFRSHSLRCERHELPETGNVPVYVDKNNYACYYVDVEAIVRP